MSGYLYRVCPADEARLRALLAELLTPPCWTFGGAALWDFVPAEGTANLRPLARVESAAALAAIDVTGDFGHCFTAAAEVRWKRRDETSYDVLVLSEQPLAIAGATTLADGWALDARRDVALSGGQHATLRAIPYQAPNGAVQVLRYVEVRP